MQDEHLKGNLEKRQREKSERKLNIDKIKQDNLKKAKGEYEPEVKEIKFDKEKYEEQLKETKESSDAQRTLFEELSLLFKRNWKANGKMYDKI